MKHFVSYVWLSEIWVCRSLGNISSWLLALNFNHWVTLESIQSCRTLNGLLAVMMEITRRLAYLRPQLGTLGLLFAVQGIIMFNVWLKDLSLHRVRKIQDHKVMLLFNPSLIREGNALYWFGCSVQWTILMEWTVLWSLVQPSWTATRFLRKKSNHKCIIHRSSYQNMWYEEHGLAPSAHQVFPNCCCWSMLIWGLINPLSPEGFPIDE